MNPIDMINNIDSLDIDHIESLMAEAHPHACEWCGGKGFVGDVGDTEGVPCHECTEKGLDPLNTKLTLENGVSPTAGVNLLDPNREKNLLVDVLVLLENKLFGNTFENFFNKNKEW